MAGRSSDEHNDSVSTGLGDDDAPLYQSSTSSSSSSSSSSSMDTTAHSATDISTSSSESESTSSRAASSAAEAFERESRAKRRRAKLKADEGRPAFPKLNLYDSLGPAFAVIRQQRDNASRDVSAARRVLSSILLILAILGSVGVMLLGLYNLMVSAYQKGGEAQEVAVTISILFVVMFGLFFPVGLLIGIFLSLDDNKRCKCLRCFSPDAKAVAAACAAAFVLFYGVGFPIVFRGADFGLFATATLFDADLDQLLAGGNGNPNTAYLGFIFTDAELGAAAGVVAAARATVPCWWAQGKGTLQKYSCDLIACVTPIWSPESKAKWNVNLSSPDRLIAAYATCFLQDTDSNNAILFEMCAQQCGDQSDVLVGPAPVANTYARDAGGVGEKFTYGVNWNWLREPKVSGRKAQGWRQFIGTASDTSNLTLLMKASSSLEQTYNATSLRDAHGDPLFLTWGGYPIPYMEESGTITMICSLVFAPLAFAISLVGVACAFVDVCK